MGAETYFVAAEGLDDGVKKAGEYMESLSETLHKKGRTCYTMPVGGSTPLGCVGFATGFLELADQTTSMGITADHLIVATGSGGTQAGLTVGKEIAHAETAIHGIRVGKMFEPFSNMIADLATETASFLEMKKVFNVRDVLTYSEFVGEGYDIPTKEANDAIKLLAKTEAIFLDPVYTGKAMAGLLGLVERGEIPRKDTGVFWHTGGDPALFVGEELLGRTFMETVKDSLVKDKNVYLRGFGSFIVKKRAKKTARNISKNTTIIIPEHFIPAFKPAKSFVNKVKNNVKR